MNERNRAAAARLLHVAALPFPSYQGTQALVLSMLQASARAGRDVHLLTYAKAGYALQPDFPLYRAPALGAPSLRSGPSAAKLLADAALWWAMRQHARTLRPDVLVAHHVEAASLAPASHPLLFFAHTDVGAELPSYLPAAFGRVAGAMGTRLDNRLAGRAAAVAAVSPWLCERFAACAPSRVKIGYVPPPWPLPPSADPELRRRARLRLSLRQDQPVVLYAGNLDAYQGVKRLLHALAMLPSATLIVATQSDATQLRAEARRAGVAGRLHVTALASEQARAELHAAADVAAIVRRTPGGLPIKLLDALSRGLPCVVTRTAAAGLSLGEAALVTADDSAALAEGLGTALALRASQRAALGQAGRGFIAQEHSAERFLSAFDGLIEHAASA